MMLLRLCLVFQVATAFVRPAPRSFVSSSVSLGADAVDAIATLESEQGASVDSIKTAKPDLALKPDFTWAAADGVSTGGSPATLDAYDAAGPTNIAWLSSLTVASKLCSLTIFNGPLTDVPHLVSRCVVDGETLRFILDFRPRAYGAYEMKKDDGSYPGPDELGRQSFEYSGARLAFDTKFGTEEVKTWLSSTVSSLEGASDYDPNPVDLDLLTRGPLYTSVSMPLTDANVASVSAAREQAVKYWLSWVADDQNAHRPGAPVNTQYVYDTKYKQNAYGALLNEYKAVFGDDDGAKLAVGDSGPLDEGYVGGGS
jgi:hypothetical protein